MVLSTVSTFSFANGLLAWVIALPVLALAQQKSWSEILKNILKNIWLYILWIVVFIASATFYFHGYQKPLAHPSPLESIQYSYQVFQYFLAFIGAALGIGSSAQPLNNSIILGLITTALFIGLCFYVVWHIKDDQLRHQTIDWIMLGSYTVISALVASVGRVMFGIEQAISSRYTTFSTYLIIPVTHLMIIVGLNWIKKNIF